MNRVFANNCSLTFDSHFLKDYLYRVARRMLNANNLFFKRWFCHKYFQLKKKREISYQYIVFIGEYS